jgi:hypothetical protein
MPWHWYVTMNMKYFVVEMGVLKTYLFCNDFLAWNNEEPGSFGHYSEKLGD